MGAKPGRVHTHTRCPQRCRKRGHGRRGDIARTLERHAEREGLRGERFAARAEVLTDAEKEEVWADIRHAIPQMKVYEQRTDRNIRVFRLSRVGS